MKRWLQRAGLTALLAWSQASGAVMAQEFGPSPTGVPVVTGPTYHHVQEADLWAYQAQHDTCGCGEDRQGQDSAPRRPIVDTVHKQISGCTDHVIGCLNGKGIGCMATHNTHGCQSLYGQYLYIFGSCREFFGDPCQPPPANGQPLGRFCTLCGK